MGAHSTLGPPTRRRPFGPYRGSAGSGSAGAAEVRVETGPLERGEGLRRGVLGPDEGHVVLELVVRAVRPADRPEVRPALRGGGRGRDPGGLAPRRAGVAARGELLDTGLADE